MHEADPSPENIDADAPSAGARPGAWLEDLTWPEAESRLEAGALVIVPVGAACKEHGHHLPLGTDWLLARALADAVARELPVLLAPIIGFGYYPAFVDYPASQTLRAATFIALVVDVLVKLVRDGARHLAILNTGVSTEAPLALAVREVLETTGVEVVTADIRNLGRDADQQLEQRHGGHADERETSLMLAIDAARVRMELAVEDYGNAPTTAASIFRRPARLSADAGARDFSRTGAWGDPSLASAAKGRVILAAMVRDLVRGLRAEFPAADGM